MDSLFIKGKQKKEILEKKMSWGTIQTRPIGKKFIDIYDSSKPIQWEKIKTYFAQFHLKRLEDFQEWIQENKHYTELDTESKSGNDHLLYIKTKTDEYFIFDFYNTNSKRSIDESFIRLINCETYDDCKNPLITKNDFYYFRHEEQVPIISYERSPELKESIRVPLPSISYRSKSKSIQSIPKSKSQPKSKPESITKLMSKLSLRKTTRPSQKTIRIDTQKTVPYPPKEYREEIKEEFKEEVKEEEVREEEVKEEQVSFQLYHIKDNQLTERFREDMGNDANVLLYPNELIVAKKTLNENYIQYITNLDYQISIGKLKPEDQPNSTFPKHLFVLHEFAKIGLAPSYTMSPRTTRFFLKIKIYRITLLKWLQQGHTKSKVEMKLSEIEKQINKFQDAGLSHLNLSLTNILINTKNQIVFYNFGAGASGVAVSSTTEYSNFADNVSKSQNVPFKDLILDWLLIKMGQGNTVKNIQAQKYFNQFKKDDGEKCKSFIMDKKYILKLKSEENTRFYKHFIMINYGDNTLIELFGKKKINTITCFAHRRSPLDNPWIFLINGKYVMKLTRASERYEVRAKYEILMHQKFLEAEEITKTKMAPQLYAYQSWKWKSDPKLTIVGWVSEKAQVLTDLIYTKENLLKKDVKKWFLQMQVYFENMCKAGLWHYDCHFGNWGFINGSMILFDYEYATDGHDKIHCTWDHELNILAYGLDLDWDKFVKINPYNLELFVYYFNQLHIRLYKLQPTSVNPPPIYNKVNLKETIASYDIKKTTNKRIDIHKQSLYIMTHADEWKPFMVK